MLIYFLVTNLPKFRKKLEFDKKLLNISFSKLNNRSIRRTASRFDLRAPNNIFQKRAPTKSLKKLPMQIKSLMPSRQLVASEIDVLALPETSTAMDINYFALQRISILKGYERDNYSYLLKKSFYRPNWRLRPPQSKYKLSL